MLGILGSYKKWIIIILLKCTQVTHTHTFAITISLSGLVKFISQTIINLIIAYKL